ncbi:restriction endonuclease subunit S [Bogoriella caseilytica]|uniref:Type I restriction enzyme S subunit n=1 Tax=Bogoriella caseilytica TaxID=56055 RepID=A0A3N2BDY0_9MICO|nr:restriction endonuclease subunit S [Bogoriella caseilytica]ROR73460.1 type I restriction enzyme S subunit [Bogoriella caseilytica]
MSRVDELIQELCQDGVERKPLGEFATLVRGNGMPKTDLVEEGVGAVHYGQIYTHYGVWATETLSFVAPETAARLAKVESGDIIITNTSENIDDVGKAVAWLGSKVIVTGGHATVIKHDQDPKYLAYWFASADFYVQKRKLATGTKVIDVSAKQMATVRIPVPPLEVQREIVRVLDQFTQLEAELEAELEARRRQYDFYARELLAADGDVPRVRFGDVAKIVRGASPRPIGRFLTDDPTGVPWIKIGDVPAGGKYITSTAQRVTPEGALKSRRVTSGDFVLSNSMSFGRPYISRVDGCIHDGWLAISDFEDSFLPDYLYYLLRSAPVQEEFVRKAGAGTVKNLNAAIVRLVVIPMPKIEEQERVVDLLDRFDALVNDLSLGLPAELAARRKQYEYYRDKLLTFEEAA